MPDLIGVLNSIIPSFITGLVGLYSSISILSRKKSEDKEAFSFALSWLLLALTYLFVSFRLSAFILDMIWLDRFWFYAAEIMGGTAFVSIMYHIVWKLTKKETFTNTLSILAAVFAVLFLFYLFDEGIKGPVITPLGSDYIPPQTASFFFTVTFAIGFAFIVIDLIKRIIQAIRKDKNFKLTKLIGTLSLFFFVSSAAIDQLAIELSWMLAFFRIMIMISAFLASLSYPSSE